MKMHEIVPAWNLTWISWIKFWPKGEKNKDYPVKTYYKIRDIEKLLHKEINNIMPKKIYSTTPYNPIKYKNNITTLGDFITSKLKPYKTVVIKENYE